MKARTITQANCLQMPRNHPARSRREFLECFVRLAAGGSALAIEVMSLFADPLARSGLLPAMADITAIAETSRREGSIEFESSDKNLVDGFRWAKNQALLYIRDSGAVGPWYEAALPGRNAFCMRDVSHMSTGAQMLGLGLRTRNMLRHFAANISASKKWCTWWEITGDGKPAPVDYKNDTDFWYDLPANFDVLDACYRQWLWTRDNAYVTDDVFLNYYRRTVTDYVRTWDHDGLLEHLPGDGHMGIATYDEDLENQVLVGADLIAAQYAAYRAYGAIANYRNEMTTAAEFTRKANCLKSLYNDKWWDSSTKSFFGALGEDGKFDRNLQASTGGSDIEFPLYFRLTEEGLKTHASLDRLEAYVHLDGAVRTGIVGGVEGLSYLPDIFYKHGRSQSGYAVLLALMSPDLKRRTYPEVSYTVIGNIGTGLMGILPPPHAGTVETFPQLTARTAWAALHHVPFGNNIITVRHSGNGETALSNEMGSDLLWRAGFPGQGTSVLVDGKRVPAETAIRPGGLNETYCTVQVASGITCVATLKNSA
jgi:hypothetical protein